jgi:hypothetical protein
LECSLAFWWVSSWEIVMLVARRPSQRVIEGTIQGDASVWKTVSCWLLYTAGLYTLSYQSL